MKSYEVQHISPKDLFFDPRNPRIAEFKLGEKASDKEIVKILWEAMGIEELVLSIKSSGFFQHEPLIAISENGKNIVLEGNRRLSAVKAILNPKLLDGVSNFNPSILSVNAEVAASLEQLPVIFVEDRKEAWKYIGFKHINGAAKWGSYAKAQYISEIKNIYGIPLQLIAEQLGDTNNTVQKLYQGLQVIEQAERAKKFDRADIQDPRLFFSHLYTALAYEGVKEFLGIQSVTEEMPSPVPADKLDDLEYFLLWLYGSKSKRIEKVIYSQNPDLRRLAAALKDKEAVYALKDGLSLSIAYEISLPKDSNFEQSLAEAKRALQKALSYQSEGFDGSDEATLRLAGSIAKIADELYESMEIKWNAKKENGKKTRLTEE
jgi:hypothetical protein